MEYVIETQSLVKQYREKFAVNNVSIHVRRGDIYGLIGKNGAGKTSLLKLLLGLTNPTGGKIFLFGGENLIKSRAKIGSLIEAPGLYRGCTAKENMLRFSLLYGADKSEIDGLLKLVGLADTGSKKAGNFSLGMRQRLGIAIALLAHPEVLILDEPINGLDPAGIKEIRDVILDLNRNQGVTIVISSHLLDELAKVVSCYGIMNDGFLVEEITAEELEKRCCHCIKIACVQAETALSLLCREFKDLQGEVKEDGVYLYSHLESAAEINKYLVNKNIAVEEIYKSSANGFEQFFIERVGSLNV